MLNHYLVKAVQEFVADTCPKKMSDEEILVTLYHVKNLRGNLVEESDLRIADYLISLLLKEGRSRGGLVFCNLTSSGDVNFASNGMMEFFGSIPPKGRKSLIVGALNTAERRGVKFKRGARNKARRYLMSL